MRSYFTQNRDFYKTLFTLALPIALQNLISSLLNMIDTVMIGQLGATAIAAVGLANQVFFLFNLLLFGVNSGAAIYIAQFWGKQDRSGIHKVQGLSMAAGLIVSLLISLSGQILTIFTLTLPIRVFNLMLVVGILRSGGDTRFCLLIDTAGLWLIAVPLAFLAGLVWRFPPQIVYLLVASEEIFKCGLGIYRLVSQKWLNNLTHHTMEHPTPPAPVAEANV